MKVKGNNSKPVWFTVLFIVYICFVIGYPKIFFTLSFLSLPLIFIMFFDLSKIQFKAIQLLKNKYFDSNSKRFFVLFGSLFTMFLSIALFPNTTASQNLKQSIPSKKLITENKVKPVTFKPIPYKLYDETTMVKSGSYNLIQCWIVANNIGNYSINQIKVTLKDMVNKAKIKYPDYDYISVYFFEREIDFKNRQPYNLGMVNYAPKEGFITLDNDVNIQDKQSYKYFYSIRNRNESERPTKKEQEAFDMFYSISTKNPDLSDEAINKIVEKKLRITAKQNEEYSLKASIFYNSDITSITE